MKKHGIFLVISLFSFIFAAPAQELNDSEVLGLVRDAIAEAGIGAEHYYESSYSAGPDFAGWFEHEEQAFVFIAGDKANATDDIFSFGRPTPNYHLLDPSFSIRPYILIAMSSEDAEYLISQINRNSPLFDVASTLRSSESFVPHIDFVSVAFIQRNGDVQTTVDKASAILSPDDFVNSIVASELQSMRIRDFVVYPYVVALAEQYHNSAETLAGWADAYRSVISEF